VDLAGVSESDPVFEFKDKLRFDENSDSCSESRTRIESESAVEEGTTYEWKYQLKPFASDVPVVRRYWLTLDRPETTGLSVVVS